MRKIIVHEFPLADASSDYYFDMEKVDFHDCTGCWTCWKKRPGQCVFSDLDQFYHAYVNADDVIFHLKVVQGFVSGNIKSLFDRMIPLFLPYTSYEKGESMHLPRYPKYPDVTVYYKGNFISKEEEEAFCNYIHRVFYQFHSKNIVVKPAEMKMEAEVMA